MKTINNIKSKEIAKRIENNEFFDIEDFNAAAKRFVKAVKEGRLIATVSKVAASGMSRNIKIVEMHKPKTGACYLLNFCAFFRVLGYRVNNDCEIIRRGCGMDMIHDTIDGALSTLHYLGILSKKERATIKANYNYL